ncbi:MAG: bifunctional (p)ppGpp synthetase/guanosine-3',5'-bis(diphosphate) 3'-pyrophosphohydrolase, partial [gamma proteobacterium symbiont of Bathyaustriella thionipta]|nr:bifunctional (p)ppGpp synthetase/guanosine-3',5'-bis(diphosphate) 3'-pyrophosphohydrolase [gamma proteobacterium symbiont of Bathyaustriella thionipta]
LTGLSANEEVQQSLALLDASAADMLQELLRIGLLTARIDLSQSSREHTENLRRLLLGIVEDVRVLLVILAKRLVDMRALRSANAQQQQEIAGDVREIYAPLANRLGIWQLKWELEDLAFRYLEPGFYRQVANALQETRTQRQDFIAHVIVLIEQQCKAMNIQADVAGRPKHIYSIARKMQRKHLPFDQIYDARAVRVLVESEADCYAVLGMVHAQWPPVPGEFDDYISRPKPNMYQSLHTAVIGPDDKPMEVQIRTHDMHEHSELGVAAHWRYKESGKSDPGFEQRILWMRQWLEQWDSGSSADELVDQFKNEVHSHHLYVLSQDGHVVELPEGATAVDFAYAIHSEVGHRCRGAKIDGRITALTQPLQSGQTVEILTAKEGGPSRDWLNTQAAYITTSRARNRIKQWFRQHDWESNVALGKEQLARALRPASVDIEKLAAISQELEYAEIDDLYEALAMGALTTGVVAARLGLGHKEKAAGTGKRHQGKKVARKSNINSAVSIQGVSGLMSKLARCCKPVPPDLIAGYLTQGSGVSVHTQNCPVLKRMVKRSPERLLEIKWQSDDAQSRFVADIEIIATDHPGLLHAISGILADLKINVIGVRTRSVARNDTAVMHFSVEVQSANELEGAIHKIARHDDVLKVKRKSG